MKSPEAPNTEPANVLYRIKRGLSGYISYLAACEMNQSFSEYLLYEPILRLLMARHFAVRCEYECPGITQPATGDKKRLDFYVTGNDVEFAVEVKWVKGKRKPDVTGDIEKLRAFTGTITGSLGFLCIFGRQSHIENISFDTHTLKEYGKPIYADLNRTKYGCRVFEFTN